MQVLDHAPPARMPSDTDSVVETRAGWSSPAALVASIVAALLIGLALLASIGPGVFTIDEMAYRTQADLADAATGTGPTGWGVPYASDEVVVQRLGAPFANAELGESGWYPYARHPFYVEVVAAAQRSMGSTGPKVLSLLAVIAGAAALELVARRTLAAVPLSTFWFVMVASPVAFHAFVVWAHALTFALFAAALALILTNAGPSALVSSSAPWVARALGAGLLVFTATLLRSESPVAGLALAGLVVVVIGPDDLRRALVTASSVVVGVLSGRVVDARWAASIIDDRVPAEAAPSLLGNDVIGNFASIVLVEGAGGLAAMRIIGTGLIAVGALWFARDRTIGTGFAVTGTVLALVGASSLEKYSTMFTAAPLIWPALILVANRKPNRLELAMLGAGVATALGAVIASPHGGGGAGWGGRYALVAFVFFIPVAVARVSRVFVGREPTRWILGLAVVATVAVQAVGLDVLHRTHASSTVVTEQFEAELAPFAERVDLLITVDTRTGRLAPEASQSVPLVTVDDDEVEPLLSLAQAAGVERIAIVGVVNEIDVDQPEGWASVERGNVKSLQYWILESQQ